ncbi:hypothetical protein [Acetobacter sp.]|uniref:hypothetical protein n=1 Tax=Acetobacter sp. TaxID=440 RepID=UPI0039ED7476
MPDRAWVRVSGVDRDGTYFVGIYNVRTNIEARAWLLFENVKFIRGRVTGLRYEALGRGDRACPFPVREMAA